MSRRKSASESLAEAWELLGVTPEQADAVPRIRNVISAAKLGDRVERFLRGSSNPIARKWLRAYDMIPSKASAAQLPPEAFCVAAGVSTDALFGALAEAVLAQTRSESALLAALAHPEVVQATIASAMLPEGGSDRKVLHQAAGFLPMPKTQILSMPGLRSIDARTQTVAAYLGPAEDDVRKLSDEFGAKILGAAPERLLGPVVESVADEDGDSDSEDED